MSPPGLAGRQAGGGRRWPRRSLAADRRPPAAPPGRHINRGGSSIAGGAYRPRQVSRGGVVVGNGGLPARLLPIPHVLQALEPSSKPSDRVNGEGGSLAIPFALRPTAMTSPSEKRPGADYILAVEQVSFTAPAIGTASQRAVRRARAPAGGHPRPPAGRPELNRGCFPSRCGQPTSEAVGTSTDEAQAESVSTRCPPRHRSTRDRRAARVARARRRYARPSRPRFLAATPAAALARGRPAQPAARRSSAASAARGDSARWGWPPAPVVGRRRVAAPSRRGGRASVACTSRAYSPAPPASRGDALRGARRGEGAGGRVRGQTGASALDHGSGER